MATEIQRGLVSVIITTYNRASLLPEAIESVLAQDYPQIELLVVDDASTDETAETVLPYVGRVTYVQKATNRGLAAARNTGIELARGEFINFLDDDDRMAPDKISRQVALLRERPEVGIAYCRHYHMDESGQYIDEVGQLPSGQVYHELVGGCFLVVHAPLARREVFDQVGVFDEHLPWEGQYCEDWDLWLRMARAGVAFACIQQPLVAYRIHRGGQVASVPKKEENAALGLLARVYDDPAISSELLADKARIFGYVYVWISARFFAVQAWPEAQQDLLKAVEVYPAFFEEPAGLVQYFVDEALGARTPDPQQFIQDVFAHLPAACQGLLPYRAPALAQVKFRLGLRAFRNGQAGQARRLMDDAYRTDGSYFVDLRALGGRIQTEAQAMVVMDPAAYVLGVCALLPTPIRTRARIRRRVLSDVFITRAIHHYAEQQWPEAFHALLQGLWRRPSWLANRGMVAMLVKSSPLWPRRVPTSTGGEDIDVGG